MRSGNGLGVSQHEKHEYILQLNRNNQSFLEFSVPAIISISFLVNAHMFALKIILSINVLLIYRSSYTIQLKQMSRRNACVWRLSYLCIWRRSITSVSNCSHIIISQFCLWTIIPSGKVTLSRLLDIPHPQRHLCPYEDFIGSKEVLLKATWLGLIQKRRFTMSCCSPLCDKMYFCL